MEVQQLVVRAQCHDMPAQRERDVVRELERALRDGVCRTKKVGAGDKLARADQHDNARKGCVREAVVPEPFVAQDQLVRPAAVHLGPPDETRGLRRRAVLLADGGQPVVAEAATGDRAGNVADQAGIEKVAAGCVRIVVRTGPAPAPARSRGPACPASTRMCPRGCAGTSPRSRTKCRCAQDPLRPPCR